MGLNSLKSSILEIISGKITRIEKISGKIPRIDKISGKNSQNRENSQNRLHQPYPNDLELTDLR